MASGVSPSLAGPFDEEGSTTLTVPTPESTATIDPSAGGSTPEPTTLAPAATTVVPAAPPKKSFYTMITEALANTGKKGIKVFSGADGINVADLNGWLVHHRTENDGANVDSFITGQETALYQAIMAKVKQTGKKLDAGQVVEIALELTGATCPRPC